MKIAVVASHPIQYQAPMFRELANRASVHVYFAHRQSAEQQAEAGYGVAFDWDVDVASGYESSFLQNRSARPGVDTFRGADTPGIADALRRFEPDAVLCMGWNLKCYWQAARVARELRVPAMVRGDSQLGSPRAAWLRALKRAAYPLILRRFDRFLPVGVRSREYLLHYGVAPSRCFVCPHTVDLDRFITKSSLSPTERADLRSGLGIAAEDLVVAFAGRFVDWKRPVHVVRAVAGLPKRERVVCVFIGSGEQEAAIRREAAAANVRIAMTGFVNQSDMPRTLALADALALASNARETWGLVANESLASGTPVVLSDEAGCAPDLSVSRECCSVYRGGDVHALTRALAQALAERTEVSVAHCHEAASRFSPSVAARAVIDAAAAS